MRPVVPIPLSLVVASTLTASAVAAPKAAKPGLQPVDDQLPRDDGSREGGTVLRAPLGSPSDDR
jgi:hypothetical protein